MVRGVNKAIIGFGLVAVLAYVIKKEDDERASQGTKTPRPSTSPTRSVPAPAAAPSGRQVPGAVTRTPSASPKYPLQMSWAEAEGFLKQRGYPHVKPGGDPTWLRGEDERCSGGEDCRNRLPGLVFDFAVANDATPPQCISVLHAFPLDWRKWVKDLTGADVPVQAVSWPKDNTSPTIYLARTSDAEVKVLVFPENLEISMGTGCEP